MVGAGTLPQGLFISSTVTGLQGLRKVLSQIKDAVDDFSELWDLIYNDIQRDLREQVFTYTGPTDDPIRRFARLAPITVKTKERRLGSAYPFLVDSGKLRGSLTGAPGGYQVRTKRTFRIGTAAPYAKYHMHGFTSRGGKKVEKRPPLFMREDDFIRIARKWAESKGAKL